MLQFMVGRAGSGKTHKLQEWLIQQRRAGESRLMLLVPEQYSFETEKAIFHMAGPVLGNEIQVFSFTRLCEAVFRKEGDAPGKRLTDGSRRILMSCALEACEDELEVYAAPAKSGRLTELMLTAVDEMKFCGISPEKIRETAEELGETGLGKKLRELGLIYGAYEALVAASYLDPRDDLTRLSQVLETSDFFEGYTVGVDSFEGFTQQEQRVLRQMLRRAKKVVVALCTDDLPDGEAGLFALVNRTKRQLSRMAEEENVSVEPPAFLTGAPRFENENLKLLEAQLFCPEETLEGDDGAGIHVFSGADAFEEADYVASTIRRLVERGECRYRDVSVICRSPQRYVNPLSAAMAKREIPCFVSHPAKVDAEPVPRLILSAFDSVRSGFRTDDLLNFLKTGVSGFSSEEISALENYAFLWKLRGEHWRSEFTRHPGGFGREFTPEDEAALARLNDLRQRLMTPLLAFRDNTADASGAEISQGVYGLLEAFHLEETLPAYCQRLEQAGEAFLAEKQLRIWDLLMEILDQLYTVLGRRKIHRDRYYQLLKEVISGEDISEIPQTLDQVLFGTAEQVRQASPKIVFLLGAAQGEFPLIPSSSGVFSDGERRELIARDMPLGDPLEKKTIEERYLAYSVACAPSRELYLSCPRQADGEEKSPSELISAVLRIFPGLSVKKNLPDEYFSTGKEAAFSRMAARYGENTPEAAALHRLFVGDREYEGRVSALERAVGRQSEKIRDESLSGALFGRLPYLSATQIEVFHSCKFRYFCRFGLNAQERRPAEVDVMQYGTLMHYIFEKTFSLPRELRAAWSREELDDHVKALIQEYADTSLGGYVQLEERQKYRLGRMAHSARLLIEHVEEELDQSSFRPAAFEMKIGGGSYPPLVVEAGPGRTVTVGGTIDRVDVFHREDGDYVRVVDYKTGRKDFRLYDVLHGLNMQMLIYLAALVEGGHVHPAGILYMPAAEPSVSAEKDMTEEEIQRKADRQLRMSGMVLGDQEIIQAMEKGAKGKFIPASLNRDGSPSKLSSVLEPGEWETVLDYSKRLISAMMLELWKGNVEARPSLANKNSCAYCPYGPVCGKEYSDKDVYKEAPSVRESLVRMKESLEGGEEHGNEMD